jgi:hypothetical protein
MSGQENSLLLWRKPPTHNQPQRVNLGVTRMWVSSLKSQEFWFEICSNWIKLKKDVAKRAKLLLQVKVTFCNPNHTCKMDKHSHRMALQKAGQFCLDFGKVKSLLFLLLEKPRLDNNTLRPYLTEALPHYKGVTAQFAVNFLNHVFEYHTKISGNSELTSDDAAALTSHTKNAADEMISTNVPMIAKNHTDLLRWVLAKDFATWKTIRYLEENKKLFPGFDFQVKYSSDGTPSE